MITENLSTLKIHKLTQEQYDREYAAGNTDATALYLTPDEGSVFTVVITSTTTDGTTTYSSDKTFDEIVEAYENGKSVYATMNLDETNTRKRNFYLSFISSATLGFSITDIGSLYLITMLKSGNILLSENAVFVNRDYSDLNTTDKTIIGAINEVSEKVSESGVFTITVTGTTVDGTTTYSADKTFEEIEAAIIAGRPVTLMDDETLCYTLSEYDAGSGVSFTHTWHLSQNMVIIQMFYIGSDNVVTQAVPYMPEDKKNKADAINADSIAYPNKYPTVKAVSSYVTSSLANYYLKTEADLLHTELHDYVDTEVAALVNSAPETLDTLGELATAFNENKEVVDALDEAITTKANQSDLNALSATVSSHTTAINALKTETWTFTLNDGSTVTKQMVFK